MSPYRFRHGVEQECQIVDPTSCSLMPAAGDLIEVANRGWENSAFAGLGEEHYETQIEFWAGIANSPDTLRSALIEFRSHLARSARSIGLAVVACGVNPVSRSARGENFGEHHHIGVESVDHAIAVHNVVRNFVPELFALSANSAGYDGQLTEWASYRAHRSPHIRFSPVLENDTRVELIRHSMGHRTGRQKRMWDVTPFVKGGRNTVEVRLLDVQFSIARSVAIAEVLQALAAWALDAPPRTLAALAQPSPAWEEAATANRSAAIKEGMRATLRLDARPILAIGPKVSIEEAVVALVEWLTLNTNVMKDPDQSRRDLLEWDQGRYLEDLFCSRGLEGYCQALIELTERGGS